MSDTDTVETPTTEELLTELLSEQKAHRAEVASLREEVQNQKVPVQPRFDVQRTAEELLEERVATIRDHSHYCPGCGRLSKYPRECTGLSADRPHPPIEMVSSEELLGDDPSQHTPAPDTTNLG